MPIARRPFPLWPAPDPAVGPEAPALPAAWHTELAAGGGRLSGVEHAEPKVRHGRRELRRLWALSDPEWLAHLGEWGTQEAPWPFVAQICRLEHWRTPCRRGQPTELPTVEVSYWITSLPPAQADAARLLHATRGHWGIENRRHWVRDVLFEEDRSQVRTRAAPHVLAAVRNLTITLLRRARCFALQATRRTLAARPHVAVHLVLTGKLC